MSAVISYAGLTIAGNYAEADPRAGLDATIALFRYAEELGFDIAGIRQRHVERGVSSALTFLAAATQRTDRIRLATDVVPLGYETPFRLAEDFATVDALSGGRVNIGISTSAPHGDLLAPLARPGAPADPYQLIERFLAALEGEDLAPEPLATPYGQQIPRIQPHIPGLRDRVWLGGGSERSVRWAAQHGLGLLLGNLTSGARFDTFEPAQREHIDLYYSEFVGTTHPAVGTERVIVPTDSATTEQREHYAAYAAAREERTKQPARIGDRTIVFHRDLVGSAAEIIDRLAADPAFDGRTQLRVALPYGFAEDEYRQILLDVRYAVLPELGWAPSQHNEHALVGAQEAS